MGNRELAMPRGAPVTDSPQPPPLTAAPLERGGQSSASDVTAESNRAHMAAAPITLPNANNTAAVAPSGPGNGYAVQVTSERSETTAQAAFLALQAKYPKQLSGRQWSIRRADLGAKGTYYRALVGPFESAKMAATLCSGLKAAGGNCIVQKY
jgi:SPOR domain